MLSEYQRAFWELEMADQSQIGFPGTDWPDRTHTHTPHLRAGVGGVYERSAWLLRGQRSGEIAIRSERFIFFGLAVSRHVF